MEHAVDEPEDAEIIQELEQRTMMLQPSRPEWPTEMTDVGPIDDLDIDYNFSKGDYS